MNDHISLDLDQLLTRLSNTLLSPTADDTHLRTTLYERNRISTVSSSFIPKTPQTLTCVSCKPQNVEYARTLLVRLEHLAQSTKTQSTKSSLQADLNTKRDLIKRLNQRLIELNQLAEDDDDDLSSEDDQDQNNKNKFGPAVPTSDTLDTNYTSSSATTSPLALNAANTLQQTLRARKQTSINTNPDAPPTTAQSTALFSKSSSSDSHNQPLSTEQLLASSSRDQEALTSSLVTLAQSLRQSSLTFASSLESEKQILARAEAGLDKNAMGMDLAEAKMGTLRRITEGKGWWGRIRLYGFIVGLWVIAFLLVFLAPKLRF
jgi:hypothetical protein